MITAAPRLWRNRGPILRSVARTRMLPRSSRRVRAGRGRSAGRPDQPSRCRADRGATIRPGTVVPRDQHRPLGVTDPGDTRSMITVWVRGSTESGIPAHPTDDHACPIAARRHHRQAPRPALAPANSSVVTTPRVGGVVTGEPRQGPGEVRAGRRSTAQRAGARHDHRGGAFRASWGGAPFNRSGGTPRGFMIGRGGPGRRCRAIGQRPYDDHELGAPVAPSPAGAELIVGHERWRFRVELLPHDQHGPVMGVGHGAHHPSSAIMDPHAAPTGDEFRRHRRSTPQDPPRNGEPVMSDRRLPQVVDHRTWAHARAEEKAARG